MQLCKAIFPIEITLLSGVSLISPPFLDLFHLPSLLLLLLSLCLEQLFVCLSRALI